MIKVKYVSKDKPNGRVIIQTEQDQAKPLNKVQNLQEFTNAWYGIYHKKVDLNDGEVYEFSDFEWGQLKHLPELIPIQKQDT